MYNRQLDTFLKVAKLGSFSKAAQALYITPSAVIQQVNSLESDLQVQLLIRTKRGVRTTEAGEFLCREGAAFIQASEAIRRQLRLLAQDEQEEICVGTSLLAKCRLFYELWVRYEAGQEKQRVRIIGLSSAEDYEQADLIEGIQDGEQWQKNKEFLELCTVPIACAVPRGHELASRRLLTLDDMRGKTLVTIAPGMSELLDGLRAKAIAAGVHVIDADWYRMSLFSMCIVNGYLLQTPACWHDIHPDLITIPCEWEYALPYGLYYHKNPSAPVRAFLDFVRVLGRTERFQLY